MNHFCFNYGSILYNTYDKFWIIYHILYNISVQRVVTVITKGNKVIIIIHHAKQYIIWSNQNSKNK